MKKIILGTFISVMITGSSFAACTYNLDATNAQLEQLQPSISQKFSFVNTTAQQVTQTINTFSGKYIFLAGSNLGVQKLLNFPLNPQTTVFGDKILPQSGIPVFEYQLNNFVPQLTGIERQVVKSGLIVYAGTHDGSIQNIVINATVDNINDPSFGQNSVLNLNFFNFNTNNSASFSYPVTLPLSSSFKLGFYINQDTQQIGFNLNGINKGYLFSVDKKIEQISILPRADIEVPAGSTAIGQNVSGTLATNSTNITLSYPSGAKDICGTTL
ncbi:hypothetical protein F966_03378 [Acinetobacter higginsii]|uniref:DUF4882 domain-containing protein n=1 Tax=Acinetobacter higginsii TaxID=70347 RepID=N8W6C3_9GAMM|nr:DUF4882 family protein [Acinetobacter higginsii]ENV07521.1 hypothetical protein F966_03378 [Acinetobacter higginsii]